MSSIFWPALEKPLTECALPQGSPGGRTGIRGEGAGSPISTIPSGRGKSISISSGFPRKAPGDSDILLLKECGIPYEGVEELALLHDVAEDSPISLEEIGAA